MLKKSYVYLIAIIACMLCAWVAGYQFMKDYSLSASDFESYYLAAKSWDEGINPYEIQNLARQKTGATDLPFPYLYTPPAAQLVMPLVIFDLRDAAILWGAGLILAYGFCMYLVGLICIRLNIQEGFIKNTVLNKCLLFIGVMVFGMLVPYLGNLQYGQINIFILLLLLVYLWYYAGAAKHQFLAGMALGAASVIKIVPVFLLLAHFRAGKSFFAGFFTSIIITVLLSILFFGLTPWVDFMDALPKFSYGKRVEGLWEISEVYNIALSGKFARLFHDDSLWIFTAGMACGIPVLVYFIWMSRKIKVSPLSFYLWAGLATILMILFSPIAYFHHLIWLYPFLAIYGLFILRHPLQRKWLWILCYMCVLLLVLINFSFKYFTFPLTASLPFVSINTIGLLLLAVMFGVSAYHLSNKGKVKVAIACSEAE